VARRGIGSYESGRLFVDEFEVHPPGYGFADSAIPPDRAAEDTIRVTAPRSLVELMRAFLRYALADPEATELGIGLYQVIELVVQIKGLVPGLEAPSRPFPDLRSGV
jgi:hypothetical protein